MAHIYWSIIIPEGNNYVGSNKIYIFSIIFMDALLFGHYQFSFPWRPFSIFMIYNRIHHPNEMRPNSHPESALIMMTLSNGNIIRVTGHLCGKFTGPRWFPAQRPVTRSFDVFFDLRLNKRLSKQPWGWWFETPALSLWRHRNGNFQGIRFYWKQCTSKDCSCIFPGEDIHF